MKRLLSMLLVVTILFSIIPANVFAENTQPTTSAQSQLGQATVNNENLTVTGTNHMGNLLSKNIQQEQAADAEARQTGYDVISLTVENNKATVEFYAKNAASLVVAIYTNDRSQLVSSSTANVTADETEVTLELPDTLPEYFHASAYLMNPKNQKPLCTALHTSMYTKEIQELLQSTINDYNPELVLNLDEQTDTNFAVYNEDTVVAPEQSGVNTVISVDDENLTYVIGNPSQEIRCLMYGDVLSLPYGEENILFIKVDRVSVSGNTATITGLPIEMQDVFSHVKIDGDADLEDAEVDTETADEGVTFEGIQEKPATRAFEGGSSASCTLSYKFFKDLKEGPEGEYGELTCQVNGSFDLKLSVGVKYYVALFKQEFQFSVDVEGSFVVGSEGTAKLTIPLGKVSIPVFAGINVGFEPKLVFELNGKLETSISITAKLGIAFVSGEGIKNISEPPKATASLKAEATIFASFDLEPNVNIIDPSVAKMSLSAPIGAEVKAKMTGSAYEGMASLTENNHTCVQCIDIGLDVKFGISAKLSFLNKKRLTWGFNIIERKWHLLDGYYSIDHNEFAWTKCPHKAYPLTVTVLNSDDQPMEGVTIQCAPEDRTLTTNGKGKVTVYLPNGEYTLTATKGDYAGSSAVKVDKDTSATVAVVLGGNVAGNVRWSLTEAGGLTIFGNGAIPSYADSSQLPWSAYISKVKSVSVSDGITGIGANAFRDHSNVTSVYIGKSVSSIDFSALEGLNYSVLLVSSGNPYYVLDAKGVLYNKNKTTLYKALFPLTLTYDVPNTVTTIASKAFSGQTGITLIHFPGNAPTIASDAFSGMNSEALYCTRTSGWTQDKLQQYGGTITWSSYDGLLGSGSFGDQFTWQVYNDGVLRISGIGQMSNYISASRTPWYKYRDSIKTAVLSNGITAIGDYAFAECTALETITIPTAVNSIGKYAFYNCSSLADISIPQAVSTISAYTFYNCSGLTEISIPESVSSIESYAFYGCSNLQSINIPERVTVIESRTFYNCSSLQEVPLHDKITTIGEYAFYNCTGFRELVVPNSITQIGKYAFANCSSVLNLRISENWNPDFTGLTIYYGAFKNCAALRSAKLPDSIVRLDDSVFSGCDSLTYSIYDNAKYLGNSKNPYMVLVESTSDTITSCNVYDGAKIIADEAFYACSSLTSITIPDSVQSIGYSAFCECSKLYRVTFGENSQLTSIGDSAFYYCSSLTIITIPDNVTRIGNSAFYSCSRLTSIDIPDGVTNIYDAAFRYCSSLTSVTFDENSQLTSIGVMAFYGCRSLTSTTIPNGVASIGNYAFFDCSKLTSVTFGENSELTSIGDWAFDSCSSLTGISIPDNVTSIGNYAFLDCSKLTSVTFGKNSQLTNIGFAAFSYCTSLTKVSAPGSITIIGSSAFSNCSGLTSVTFGKNSELASICSYAFSNCTSLTDITIPDSVTSVDDGAFSNCTSLTRIIFLGKNAPAIGADAFEGVTAIALYPWINSNWTSDVKQNYGGTITWEAYTYDPTRSISYSGTTEQETKASAESRSAMSTKKSSTLSGNTKKRTVTFEDLEPGEEYIFLSLVSENEENPLIYENLLFIDQLCADENGTITVSYRPRFASDSVYELVRGGAVKNLAEATVTWPGYTENGAQQFFAPTVSYNAEALTENVDYVLEGETSFSAQGTYHCYVVGIGDYIGSYPCTYTVAEYASEGLRYTLNANGDAYTVSGIGTCTDTEIIIPTKYNDLPVTSIGASAFSGCSSLTSITIPYGVTGIGASAFWGCSSLTSVTIRSSVTGIGNSAFSGCSSLRDVYYNGTAARWAQISIGENNSQLTNATLHTVEATLIRITITKLPIKTEYWIGESLKLTGLGLMATYSDGSTQTIIGGYAVSGFNSTTVGTKTLTVTYNEKTATFNVVVLLGGTCGDNLIWRLDDDGTLAISGTGAMADYNIIAANAPWYSQRSSIKSVIINNGVTGIGSYAFFSCSSLKSITIPDSVTSIGDYAFSHCSSLTSITIPESVTSIGNYAFNECSSLTYNTYDNAKYLGNSKNPYMVLVSGVSTDITSCAIHNDTKFIHSEAFRGCSSLTSITIPESVTSIGSYAFYGCRSLTSITIPDSVTSIGYYAFYSCSSLTSVTIPSGVTSIGMSAFMNCSSLTSITIPESVTSIGNDAFYNCSALNCNIYDNAKYLGNSKNPYMVLVSGVSTDITSCTIHNDTKFIHSNAFDSCRSLTSITIPESVTSIGSYAFRNCRRLTSVTFGENIQLISIGDSAFTNCIGLTSVTIPDSVTSIGDSTFYSCSKLTSVTIPDSVTSIGGSAFEGCSKLTSITIPDGVTSIGNSAFYNCSGLTSVTFGENSQLTSIGIYAFYNCSSMTGITIPNSVQSIGSSAFEGCNRLTSVTIPDSVTGIGLCAFSNCSGLTSITIPDSVTSIGYEAFSGCSGLRKIEFLGSAPSISSDVFSRDTLTAYYPGNDATWTADVMKTYGATSIQWVAAKAMVYSPDGMEGMYGTLVDAIAACQQDQRIVLITDVAETISADKDLYIDLNGHTLEGLTVEGTLYCTDSTASATTAGTGIAKVTGNVARDHTVDGVRYIALGNNGSYTFHALQLKLSFVTFRVNAAGIYYKAEVVCDPVLQGAIDSYGVALSLHHMPGIDFATNANVDYTQINGTPAIGKIFTSGSVFGIFKDGKDNAQRGQEKIYANAYIKLKDSTCLMSDLTTGDQVTDQNFDGVAWSLRDVLTQLNSTFDQRKAEQQTQLKEFCTTWKDAVSGWNLNNILKNN